MNTVGDGAETPHVASVCGDKPPAAFFPTIDDWFAEENHHRIATDHAIVHCNLDATIVNGSPPNLLEKSQSTTIFSRWISDLCSAGVVVEKRIERIRPGGERAEGPSAILFICDGRTEGKATLLH